MSKKIKIDYKKIIKHFDKDGTVHSIIDMPSGVGYKVFFYNDRIKDVGLTYSWIQESLEPYFENIIFSLTYYGRPDMPSGTLYLTLIKKF